MIGELFIHFHSSLHFCCVYRVEGDPRVETRAWSWGARREAETGEEKSSACALDSVSLPCQLSKTYIPPSMYDLQSVQVSYPIWEKGKGRKVYMIGELFIHFHSSLHFCCVYRVKGDPRVETRAWSWGTRGEAETGEEKSSACALNSVSLPCQLSETCISPVETK